MGKLLKMYDFSYSLLENLYRAAANITALKNMKVSLGKSRFNCLFSKGANAIKYHDFL